jgi:hypothetical protein
LGYELRHEVVDVANANWPAWARVMHARGVVGILVSPLVATSDLPGFPWERFSIVGAGRSAAAPQFAETTSDVFAAVLVCRARLRAAGCRRIGFAPLVHQPEHPDDELRHAACLVCQVGEPAAKRVPVLRLPITGGPGSEDAVVAWWRRHKPDGIVGFHPGLLHVLREAGVSSPEDVRFAALNVERDIPSHAGVSGLQDSIGAIQCAAVELLDQHIRHHRRGLDPSASRVVVEPVWVPGSTCPG